MLVTSRPKTYFVSIRAGNQKGEDNANPNMIIFNKPKMFILLAIVFITKYDIKKRKKKRPKILCENIRAERNRTENIKYFLVGFSIYLSIAQSKPGNKEIAQTSPTEPLIYISRKR